MWPDSPHLSHIRVFRVLATLDRFQRQVAQICSSHLTQSDFSGILFLFTYQFIIRFYTLFRNAFHYNQSYIHVSVPLNGPTTCVDLELCQPMDTMNDDLCWTSMWLKAHLIKYDSSLKALQEILPKLSLLLEAISRLSISLANNYIASDTMVIREVSSVLATVRIQFSTDSNLFRCWVRQNGFTKCLLHIISHWRLDGTRLLRWLPKNLVTPPFICWQWFWWFLAFFQVRTDLSWIVYEISLVFI